jgi:membrane fusion protein (multidrug efflux system)
MGSKTLLTSIFLLILGIGACGDKTPVKPPPPEVQVVVTQAQDVPLYQEFVGQVYGFKDIAIRARVEGFLEQIHFQEGSQVEKGALLYTLESQPFEADVAAKMSRVAEAKVLMAKAKSDLARIEPLAARNAVSQSDLDASQAQYEASQASVAAANANLRAARIQLSYTKILSPVTGIIGKTSAYVGDFVGRSQNTIVLNVVSNIDSVLVEFFLTENQYLKIARFMAKKKKTMDVRSEDKVDLDLILSDGSRYGHTGKVTFMDRQVDPNTGAILLQASFPNPNKLLRPGQFGKVRAHIGTADDGILIPQRCVTELQGLFSVAVVNKDKKIEKRDVKLGPKIGVSSWLVLDGLKPGEQIVYEGLQRIASGMAVRPVEKSLDAGVKPRTEP